MRDFIVGEKDAGKRVDRFVAEKRADLPRVLILKAVRLKKIKVNGKRTEASAHLAAGDTVSVYLAEREAPAREDAVSVVYEDARILVADKPAGLACEDRTGTLRTTLLREVKAYLTPKGEDAELCHRIDLNTAGLVLFAKDGEALDFLTGAIRRREIEKKYLCIAAGRVPPAGELRGFLWKDAKKNRVYVTEESVRGAKTAVTRYRTLAQKGGLSIVEAALVTGRTHQIRAQMAHAGWPLLGDEKYGDGALNKKYKEKRQLLCAYKLTFTFAAEGPLAYLAGKTIALPRVAFREKYFQ